MTPLPLKGADAVFPASAVSVTTSVPERVPSTDGVKRTVMAQVAPGFTALEQVLVAVNSPFDGTAVKARTDAPVLVSVIVFAVLVVPMT
ncbi:MAG TPA: hypothetical protein VFI52_04895 [Gemmatimonadaceae bacterium]|nr:hypothetical protein [Gemmatimonadaceae bacterium]